MTYKIQDQYIKKEFVNKNKPIRLRIHLLPQSCHHHERRGTSFIREQLPHTKRIYFYLVNA